jgi:RNA polymerase sigma factor (TIGR02999 family)
MTFADESATEHLRAHLEGDPQAAAQLIPLVYDELRRIAAQRLAEERAGHTLQPTALVHEALARLIQADLAVHGRTRFLALAARTMRRVLVDHARARRAQKRPRVEHPTALEAAAPTGTDPVDVVALDDALAELERRNERQARVVEFKFFGGLTTTETAELLGVSPDTVKLDWRFARAWLQRALDADGPGPDPDR